MNYLIFGAPGSGKTTFVKKIKRWDDYVVDLDALYQAVTFNPKGEKPVETFEIMQKLFEAAIEILEKDKERNLYIIKCAPQKEQREFLKDKWNTYNILIKCHSITCQKRRCEGIKSENMRNGIIKYIDRWFQNYQEGCIDEIINGY